ILGRLGISPFIGEERRRARPIVFERAENHRPRVDAGGDSPAHEASDDSGGTWPRGNIVRAASQSVDEVFGLPLVASPAAGRDEREERLFDSRAIDRHPGTEHLTILPEREL